jgi:hypothetical protein
VREQKYYLLRAKYDEFNMLPNECCNDIFSRLNLIVNELNSLNVSNLDKGMINCKIRTHKMSVFGISEKPTTSNSIAFKANAKKTKSLR